jgi:hypothetical protein
MLLVSLHFMSDFVPRVDQRALFERALISQFNPDLNQSGIDAVSLTLQYLHCLLEHSTTLSSDTRDIYTKAIMLTGMGKYEALLSVIHGIIELEEIIYGPTDLSKALMAMHSAIYQLNFHKGRDSAKILPFPGTIPDQEG